MRLSLYIDRKMFSSFKIRIFYLTLRNSTLPNLSVSSNVTLNTTIVAIINGNVKHFTTYAWNSYEMPITKMLLHHLLATMCNLLLPRVI